MKRHECTNRVSIRAFVAKKDEYKESIMLIQAIGKKPEGVIRFMDLVLIREEKIICKKRKWP